MAAGIIEPTGKAAGRVTITTTLTSLIPPFAAVFVVVACALLEVLEKETAGAVVLGILATAGLTTGTVFTTAKKTPTDQARLIWGSQPVADVVTPVPQPVSAGEQAIAEAEPMVLAEEAVPAGTGAHRTDVSLADEVAQARTGSTAGGAA